MSIFIRIPLALELVLLGVEHMMPSMTKGLLPLGGDSFVQLAILLVLGIGAQELRNTKKRQ